MSIAVPDEAWKPYRTMTPQELAKRLKQMAKHVKLSRYPKAKRGPKKRVPKQLVRRGTHVATARLIKARRKQPLAP